MTRELVQTRKHNGEKYNFFLCSPQYKGETGILGIELEPYVEIETEDNSIISIREYPTYDEQGKFTGYEKYLYSEYYYMSKGTKKALLKQVIALMNKLGIN